MSVMTLDHNASKLVTAGFRMGTEAPTFTDYERPLDLGHTVDLDAVRAFIDECIRRFKRTESTDADAWLAPRLHYALRLTRREAADRGLWRWLGVVFAPDYIRWRWGSPDPNSDDPEFAAKPERFDGPDYKHGLGRLWWMAELFRDGTDYSSVSLALQNQDIPNNLFRMDVAHHRPTVQAAVRVLAGRTGREANALAKAVNSAATTLVMDTIAPDVPLDAAAVALWIADAGDVDPGRYFDATPPGPTDPPVDEATVDVMSSLLEELFAEAPVRGQVVEGTDA